MIAVNIRRNILAFYFISIALIIIYSSLHYKLGELQLYLPFYIALFIVLTGVIIYFYKTQNYKKTIIFFFIGSTILAYPAFIYGCLDNSGYIWSILILSSAYILMDTTSANRFASIYIMVLLITIFFHFQGLITLPYPSGVYINFLITLFIIVYVGNSVVKDLFQEFYKIEKISNLDPLTELLNRRAIFNILEQEINRAKKFERPLSILVIDIDNFKEINDTYGHIFGDKIIKEVANVIKNSVRSSDFIGRWGGEEFIVILPETKIKDAVDVAEKIRLNIQKFFKSKYKMTITASIGVEQLKNEDTLENLLERADINLYLAKTTGKNRVIYEVKNKKVLPEKNSKFNIADIYSQA